MYLLQRSTKRVVQTADDVDSWSIFDWDRVDDEQATDANVLLAAQSELSQVTIGELLTAQMNDKNYRKFVRDWPVVKIHALSWTISEDRSNAWGLSMVQSKSLYHLVTFGLASCA